MIAHAAICPLAVLTRSRTTAAQLASVEKLSVTKCVPTAALAQKDIRDAASERTIFLCLSRHPTRSTTSTALLTHKLRLTFHFRCWSFSFCTTAHRYGPWTVYRPGSKESHARNPPTRRLHSRCAMAKGTLIGSKKKRGIVGLEWGSKKGMRWDRGMARGFGVETWNWIGSQILYTPKAGVTSFIR